MGYSPWGHNELDTTERLSTHIMFIGALFTIAKIWKQSKRPLTDEWIKKICIYIQRNTTQPLKNEVLSFTATWMDLKGIMLSEINQREKDKYCTLSLICGI